MLLYSSSLPSRIERQSSPGAEERDFSLFDTRRYERSWPGLGLTCEVRGFLSFCSCRCASRRRRRRPRISRATLRRLAALNFAPLSSLDPEPCEPIFALTHSFPPASPCSSFLVRPTDLAPLLIASLPQTPASDLLLLHPPDSSPLSFPLEPASLSRRDIAATRDKRHERATSFVQ
ncbi:hypothetical protein BDZ90DRAFT_177133 [Jaminaea rosea]|uniref:Uncharacterized protein n=1 Tax=Jaminaea rosea TaxID=1569628 RepID=A0A316UQ26_9BASI|nr:hypothetical protein BDZ90DRAFT_177133 [Jaminaea rosea]PWN27390.1 hypothetical protein BDZ90DRAFT_177133 [Jaminaea rosea]